MQTIVSHSIAKRPMKFSINASTKISFWGDRYLHGYVSHQFSGHSGIELSLSARARQFSRYIPFFLSYIFFIIIYFKFLLLSFFLLFVPYHNTIFNEFYSFILMVGTIISADQFDPKYAIIIQNKDDLKIPLLLETLPTPKEFKDAIESLSPEQQRFCKAFRSMQLGTHFQILN